jgi:hypothetical protein
MLPTASGRWILVYEGANTVSEQTFHSLQSLFYGVENNCATFSSANKSTSSPRCCTSGAAWYGEYCAIRVTRSWGGGGHLTNPSAFCKMRVLFAQLRYHLTNVTVTVRVAFHSYRCTARHSPVHVTVVFQAKRASSLRPRSVSVRLTVSQSRRSVAAVESQLPSGRRE